MKNFLITSLGASGTKFLAHVMNTSRIWTVTHEALTNTEAETIIYQEALKRGDYINFPYSIQEVQDKIKNRGNFYGEINARFRNEMDLIKVRKQAIILRDPREIFLSWYELYNGNLSNHYYQKLMTSLSVFDIFIQSGGKVIEFDKMVSSISYLEDVLKYFEITDVPISENTLKKKINQHRTFKYDKFKDIPIKDRGHFNGVANWFIHKYFQ